MKTANPAPQIGQALTPWLPGGLDIHHISTGKGNATFFILPDGTTMLIDAGALHPTNPRDNGPRAVPPRPDGSRTPGAWISRYIKHMLAHQTTPALDYVLLTHFHSDHLGAPSELAPLAQSGHYQLVGLTEVGEHIPMHKLFDRAWPDYAYPIPLENDMVKNYRAFLDWQRSHNGLTVERFAAGRADQLVLQHAPAQYDNFEIRNVAVNGEVWTGVGTNTRQHFPSLAYLEPYEYPNENLCSIALRLSYGKFDYFTGADLIGMLELGAPLWHDLETPVAQVVGPVEVNVVNHHGNRSSANPFLLSALRPQVHILQTWSSDHPGHGVIKRLLSDRLYPGPRDVFATSIMEVNKLVIGDLLARLSSDQGHILVRVALGGETYQVIILDDLAETYQVTAVHGPYQAR